MDAYAEKGLRKLFSLAKTKIRLAEEAGTLEAAPHPLPLVKMFRGIELNTVAECRTHWQTLRDEPHADDLGAAYATLQLIDIVECVKHRFEPLEYMPLMDGDGLAEVEAACRGKNAPLNVLLMTTDEMPESLYFGEDPPQGARHYSRVVSGVAPFLHYAYGSKYFSEGLRLRSIRAHIGRRTLIADAVYHALQTLIA